MTFLLISCWPLCLLGKKISWALVLTWASWIRTTGMWSLLPCFGVAMLDRVIASSSSSMAGRNSELLSVVCDPKPRSSAKPRVLWLKELLLSFRDAAGNKKNRWNEFTSARELNTISYKLTWCFENLYGCVKCTDDFTFWLWHNELHLFGAVL